MTHIPIVFYAGNTEDRRAEARQGITWCTRMSTAEFGILTDVPGLGTSRFDMCLQASTTSMPLATCSSSAATTSLLCFASKVKSIMHWSAAYFRGMKQSYDEVSAFQLEPRCFHNDE